MDKKIKIQEAGKDFIENLTKGGVEIPYRFYNRSRLKGSGFTENLSAVTPAQAGLNR